MFLHIFFYCYFFFFFLYTYCFSFFFSILLAAILIVIFQPAQINFQWHMVCVSGPQSFTNSYIVPEFFVCVLRIFIFHFWLLMSLSKLSLVLSHLIFCEASTWILDLPMGWMKTICFSYSLCIQLSFNRESRLDFLQTYFYHFVGNKIEMSYVHCWCFHV